MSESSPTNDIFESLPAKRDVIQVSWPRKMPDGELITKAGLKAAWKEIMLPLQEGAAISGEMSEELRTLLAAFRHIYTDMPEDVE